MENLWLDLRYALRSLRRTPGFTAIAILTLGVGIGSATAGFSLLNRLLLQPLPGVREPGRLAFVTFMQPFAAPFAPPGSFTPAGLNPEHRAEVVRASPAVLDLSGWDGPLPLNVGAPGALAVRAEGAFVSGNYLQILDVETQRGRLLIPDDNAEPLGVRVAVISDHLWSELYGRRSDVIGSTLLVNGLPFTLVGVTSSGFRGPDRIEPADLWLPGNTFWDVQHFPINGQPPHQMAYYRTLTRLRPGATFEQAAAQLQGAVRALATTDSAEFNSKATATVVPGVGIERGGEAIRHETTLIMAVAGLVLLVACANIANLLLFRRAQRLADIVVRLSLGASRGRLIRLFLTESGLVGLAGGGVGVAMAFVLRALFGRFRVLGFLDVGDVGPVSVDLRVVGFAVVVGVMAALLAGVLPAILTTRADLNANLKASSPHQARGSAQLRLVLASLQLAVSLALVAGTYLFADTLRNYARIPLGFAPDGVSIFLTDPREAGYDAQRTRAYYEQMTTRIAALPGVNEVGLVDVPPFSHVSFGLRMRYGDDSISVDGMHVSPGYFAMLHIPILRGSTFQASDQWHDSLNADKKVILSLSVARRLFGDRDPIGQIVDFPGRRSFRATVVGVAGDVRSDFVGPVASTMYQPAGDWPIIYSPTLLVKSTVPDAQLTRAVREVARGVDGAITIDARGGLPAQVAASISSQRLFFRVVGTLSLLTLVLTAVGVYGIVAYGVTTRTREFGIRTALGALPGNLIRVALGPALAILIFGTATGIAGALYLTKFIAASLYGVSRFDPSAFLVAAAVLGVAVLVASWVPARRAAKIDPMVALRYE